MNAAFASRPMQPGDLPFVFDSFWRSYQQMGHTHGIRDVFPALVSRPFRQLLETSDADLCSTTVVYPKSEPSEIAGYSVQSARHSCLLYVLTKPTYAGLGVARHLLAQLPLVEVTSGPALTQRRLVHVFSTAAFARLTKKMELRCNYSPFLFTRMCWELQEPTNV